MTLTANTAADQAGFHIQHALAGSLSSEISNLGVINLAGKLFCSMRSWRWLDRREYTLGLEKDQQYVVMPKDVGTIRSIRHTSNPEIEVPLVSMDEIHRSRITTTNTYPYRAAVSRRTLPEPNLLLHSDDMTTANWGGDVTVTADQEVDPFTNTTIADKVEDDSAGAVEVHTQTIYPKDLKDNTPYTATVVMRPFGAGANPPKAGVYLASKNSDVISRMEVQWTAASDTGAPTLTMIGTNTPGAVALTPVSRGEAYWEMSISGYLHQQDTDFGHLVLGIEPARASFASASGTETVGQTGSVSISRAWVNEGYLPREYEATGSSIVAKKELQPVLELSPTPSATDEDGFVMLYRGQWVDVEAAADQLPLPQDGFCDLAYLLVLRAVVKGLEEEDHATVGQRIAALENDPIMRAAYEQDALIQANYGQYERGSAYNRASRRRYVPNYFNSIGGPTAAT